VATYELQYKIENFKRGIGTAEKSHETRRDCWGGICKPQIPILTLGCSSMSQPLIVE